MNTSNNDLVLTLEVCGIRDVQAGIREFSLRATQGVLPEYAPGAHLVLHLNTPHGLRTNAYSLVGASPIQPQANALWRIAVHHNPQSRGGSAFLHEHVQVGSLLEAEAPFTDFAPDWRARHHLLIAGGIGITPFMSLVPALLTRKASMRLYYLARSDAPAYAEDLRVSLASRLHLINTLAQSRPDPVDWLAQAPAGTHLYVCGPNDLIQTVRDGALGLGWPEQRIHTEAFSAAPVSAQPFRVQLESTGQVIDVSGKESLLSALERSGITRPYQCRSGVCGRCITPYTRGVVAHGDLFLSPEQRKTHLMPCVSRGQLGECLNLAI